MKKLLIGISFLAIMPFASNADNGKGNKKAKAKQAMTRQSKTKCLNRPGCICY